MFRSMNRILRWTKGYHRRLYLGSLCSFLATWAAAGPVMLAAWALGLVIESAQEGTALDARLPWLCLGGIILLIVLRFVCAYWKNRLQESIGTERAAQQRLELGDLLKRVSLGYFSKNNLGDILAALTTELSTLELQSMKMVDAVINGYLQVLVIVLCMAFFCPEAALVAVVGRGMRTTRGTSGRIFSALAHANIEVKMIDQGSSGLNVIIGVPNDDFEAAVKAIYDIFVTTQL